MAARNLNEVIDKMREWIPECEASLLSRLDSIKDSAMYASPEMMHSWWNEVTSVLGTYIYPPTKNWHFEVLSIFSTKSVEEIKKYHNQNGGKPWF